MARRGRVVRCGAGVLGLWVGLGGIGTARAEGEEDAANSLPGSSRAPGVSLSPEAPPSPPAPGGRAPSFGAPTDKDAWVFRLGGRLSAGTQLGIGRRPQPAPDGYSGTALHTPPYTLGSAPIFIGSGANLNFQYGNKVVMATVSYDFKMAGEEWNGYRKPEDGPRVVNAYLTLTPPTKGRVRPHVQVGAFTANYGGPGQWGWGIFGPVVAIRGYGGLVAFDQELTTKLRTTFEVGVQGVPEVPEAYVRGTYTEWPENGLSTIVSHAHVGLSHANKLFATAHLAHADGRNLRVYLDEDDLDTREVERGVDGRVDIYALELRWIQDPFGQLGVTPVLYDLKNALSVHSGVWWGLEWTAGGRELSRSYLGQDTDGTGRIAAVSTEYDFSVARMLKYPDSFDGQGRDLRVALAFLPYFIVQSDDASQEGQSGYRLGTSFEHVLTRWLSTTYRVYGQGRQGQQTDIRGITRSQQWTAYSTTLGLAFHTDWQSRDRLEIAYSHFFYSGFVDQNPAKPLDREVFTLAASLAF